MARRMLYLKVSPSTERRHPMKKTSKKTNTINKLSFPEAPRALKVKTSVTAGDGREGALVPCVRPGALIPCVRTIQPCIRVG
jgi:hypothetical protein